MESVAGIFSSDFVLVPAGKRARLAGERVGPEQIFAFTHFRWT